MSPAAHHSFQASLDPASETKTRAMGSLGDLGAWLGEAGVSKLALCRSLCANCGWDLRETDQSGEFQRKPLTSLRTEECGQSSREKLGGSRAWDSGEIIPADPWESCLRVQRPLGVQQIGDGCFGSGHSQMASVELAFLNPVRSRKTRFPNSYRQAGAATVPSLCPRAAWESREAADL